MSIFATHAILRWTTDLGHYSSWPTAIAVGAIIALAVVRMTREQFLPLEKNLVRAESAEFTFRRSIGSSTTRKRFCCSRF